MFRKTQKIFICFLIVLTLFSYFQREIVYCAAAYDVEKNFTQEKVGRVAIPLAVPLIAEYAVPIAGTILVTCFLGVATAQNTASNKAFTDDAIQELLTGFQNSYDDSSVIKYFQDKIQKLHPATIGYLIMAGAGADNTAVEEDMEEAGWNPQFIQQVKEELTGGGGTGGSDQDPKGKITIQALKKFGVFALMSISFITGLFALLKGTQKVSSTDMNFGKVYGLGTNYRYIPLLKGESGRTTGSGTFSMRYAKDLNMDLVQQVNIKMGRTKLYNYGWDGVVYKQEYLLNSINGNGSFLFILYIGKALSPNQYNDTEWDGITFAFYQLDEFKNIVTDSAFNMYNNSLDTARLEMASSLPKYGKNLYQATGTNDVTGFKYMRNKIKDALGADLFPQFDDAYNFMVGSSYLSSVVPFCDFSKGVSGTYNSLWKSIDGEAIFNDFVTDGKYDIVFPTDGISTGKDFIGNKTSSDRVLSDSATSPNLGHSAVDTLNSGDSVFHKDTSKVTVDTGAAADVPTDKDLSTSFPNVGDVDVGTGTGSDTDTGTDTGTGSDSVTGTVSPPFVAPNIKVPEFNIKSVDFSPLVLNAGDMKNKFPFSIPWDMYNLISNLRGVGLRNRAAIERSSSNMPIFSFDLLDVEVRLDLSMFEKLFGLIKFFVGLTFILALMFLTKKLTQ